MTGPEVLARLLYYLFQGRVVVSSHSSFILGMYRISGSYPVIRLSGPFFIIRYPAIRYPVCYSIIRYPAGYHTGIRPDTG